MSALKPVVLFLCAGNSCRSQMAEGFLRAWAGERFEARSAGLDPKEAIHPLAAEVMREVGIELRGQSPKNVKDYLGKLPARYVMFLCERPEAKCPQVYPGVASLQFWPFEAPSAFVGSQEELLEKFRELRDQIGVRIQNWLCEENR